MKVLKFPEDFTRKSHHVIPGATQWLFEYNDENNEMISIVGGGFGIHGDGVRTFEMWDTKNMMDPQGHITTEEINAWLEDHPIEGA
jgi:hypothetical protein